LQAASEASEALAAERASWRRDEAAIRSASAAEEARLRERLAAAEAQVAATAAFRERERAMEVDAAVLQDAVTQLQGELLEQACKSFIKAALLFLRPATLRMCRAGGYCLANDADGQLGDMHPDCDYWYLDRSARTSKIASSWPAGGALRTAAAAASRAPCRGGR